MWYLAGGFGIGYVEPDGHSAVYLVTGARTMSTPGSLTVGPDGNVWFPEVDRDRVVRMTPSGVATRFDTGITPGAHPFDITTGPDGSLWFSEGGVGRIGRITVDGSVTEFGAGITGEPSRIVGGGGGSLWFTEIDATGTQFRLARITTAGVVTELPIEANARITDLTSDAAGNVWVIGNTVGAGGTTAAGWIDRITPAGAITRKAIGSGFDLELTKTISAVDGDLWFSMEAIDIVDGAPDLSTYDPAGSLWRMTPDGSVTRFDTTPVHPLGVPDGSLFPPIQHVVGGPDGALWFTRYPAFPNLYRGTVPDHVGDPCSRTGTPSPVPTPPVTGPATPRIVKVTAGRHGRPYTASVQWKPPVHNGGAEIRQYQVRALVQDKRGRWVVSRTSKSLAPTRRGMTMRLHHRACRFQVRAANGAGWSPWSNWSHRVTAR
jgi:streptogramin lyase